MPQKSPCSAHAPAGLARHGNPVTSNSSSKLPLAAPVAFGKGQFGGGGAQVQP